MVWCPLAQKLCVVTPVSTNMKEIKRLFTWLLNALANALASLANRWHSLLNGICHSKQVEQCSFSFLESNTVKVSFNLALDVSQKFDAINLMLIVNSSTKQCQLRWRLSCLVIVSNNIIGDLWIQWKSIEALVH